MRWNAWCPGQPTMPTTHAGATATAFPTSGRRCWARRCRFPFADKELRVGTWQQVVLVDFDNRPRQREIPVAVHRRIGIA